MWKYLTDIQSSNWKAISELFLNFISEESHSCFILMIYVTIAYFLL